MKKEMLLGLLLLGLTFAQPEMPTSGMEWSVFKQTVCQGVPAWFQTMAVSEAPYWIWDDECYVPEMPYSAGDVCDQICGEGGIWYYYWVQYMDCEEYGAASPECQAAKREFYSSAKYSRGMFYTNMNAHMLFARRALMADRYHGCGTGIETISDVIRMSMFYNQCLAEDPNEFVEDLIGFCEEECGGET